MSIFDRFSGIERIESRLSEAEADLLTKQATLDSLIVDGATDDGPAVAKAADALAAAKRRAENLRSALQAAKAKEATQKTESELQARRDNARKILQAAEARHTAGTALVQSSRQYAADYLKFLQANESLAALLPPNRDNIADMSDRPTLETRIRRFLAKLGLRWAFATPFGTVDLPELADELEAATEVVRRSVQKDLE